MTDADARGSILSADELAEMRAEHRDVAGGCEACNEFWPCDASQLLVYVKAQQRDFDLLRRDFSASVERLAQADTARLSAEQDRDAFKRLAKSVTTTVAAQAKRITHLETALHEITGFPTEAVTGRELAKYRGDIARRALAASPLRQGCICQCCDHSEGSDCACDCHASGLCSAALVASRSPAQEKP